MPKSGSSTVARRADRVPIVTPPSCRGGGCGVGRPRPSPVRASADRDDLVRLDRLPRPDGAIRPGDPDARRGRRSKPDMDREELAAGVPAPDRDLAMDDRPADLDVDPRA